MPLLLFACKYQQENHNPPNVVFISIDDLNDWITLYDPGNPIQTPNLERLARKGVFFDRAYSSSPACNPSRVSLLTGLRPSTTGVYANKANWREALPEVVSLPAYFRKNGYQVLGAGKIFHENMRNLMYDSLAFDTFNLLPDPPDGKFPDERLCGITHWVGGRDNAPISKLSLFDWGAKTYENEAQHPDVMTTDWVVDKLKKVETPFFLAAGIFRPHMPYYAPKRYFEMYPLDEIKLPPLLENDRDDLPAGALQMLKEAKPFVYQTIKHGNPDDSLTMKKALRAYMACATFADHQVGKILGALEQSGHEKNTVIVLWSDHGYHLGEKKHWEKFALWEKTNHIPLLLAGPGVAEDKVCAQPVDLIHLYPTLADLCGLDIPDELDGQSMKELLWQPATSWSSPAIMTFGYNNHAIRDRNWRYIVYEDGSEELYDHTTDHHEWYNLANEPKYDTVIARLRKYVPKVNVPPASVEMREALR